MFIHHCPVQERYISLLTDFGFKRLFGTESNKVLLIDLLNSLLPQQHTIADLTYKNNENLGNTQIDRKAIFDIYCESKTGEKFIVEIQKAKQNFFKDRSVYYSTFPIQEQAKKGDFWDFELSAVYTIGFLNFVFDDHKDDDTVLHRVQLKNQYCEVFYDKLMFIYVQLPKFQKTLEQLENNVDKWLFLLKNLPELDNPPDRFQSDIFNQLFEVAEIANFSREEQAAYENSLKYSRDLNNVVNTARQEGVEQGIAQGVEIEKLRNLERQRSIFCKQLSRKLGEIPEPIQQQIDRLSLESLERLSELLFDFARFEDLQEWLDRFCDDPRFQALVSEPAKSQ